MTIAADSLPRNDYLGNGTLDTYAFGFRIYEASNLLVKTRSAAGVETTLTYPTDYTIDGINEEGGGSITLTAGNLASGVSLSILFDDAINQPTDIKNQGALFLSAIEQGLDRLTRFVQMLEDRVNRSMRLPVTEAGDAGNTEVPTLEVRKNKFWAWDSVGAIIPAAGTSANLGPVSAFIDTLLPAASAAAARSTLGLNVDAAGDLYVATADNVITRKAVGAENGMLLGVDLSQADKLLYMHPPVENPIINGNMEVWQRGTTFAAIAGGGFGPDRWKVVHSTSAVAALNRSTDVPTVAEAGVLFNYSLEIDITTADAAIAAGDFFAIHHVVEGHNWRPFAQRACIASFWVKSPKTGVHSVGLSNSGPDRTYVGTYTVNVVNTWEYKTVAFVASPATGNWNYLTGIGAVLSFTLAGGSAYHSTVGSWQTTGFGYTPVSSSQVNCLDSTANFFRITGVKLELGSVATPIRFVPFADELARCERYYQKSFPYATTPAQNIGNLTGEWAFPAVQAGATTQKSSRVPFSGRMRADPTVGLFSPSAASAEGRNETRSENLTSTSAVDPSENGFFVQATGSAGTVAGDTLGVHWTANAEL